MPDRLFGLAEIAAQFAVSKRTALSYSQRGDFPAPVARLAAGPVWDADLVEKWAVETLPIRKGRPPGGAHGSA